MIIKERILGLFSVFFGALLLAFLIPTYVSGDATDIGDPTLFPRIAGWLFVFLGGLQVIFAAPSKETLPSKREISRLILFMGAMLIGTALLPIVGFIPYAMGLMAVVLVLVFERRPLWILLTVIFVPIGTWLLFEQVLQRPLP